MLETTDTTENTTENADTSSPYPEDTAPSGPVKVGEYPAYAQAQQAVDTLSDDGFPVSEVSIVWANLRHIEYVTGRQTVLTAALRGAATGAWFGSFLGLLFAGLGDTAETTIFGAVLAYALTGAVVVGIYRALGHWARRGTRDFATTGMMDAERYEVWVDAAVAPEATRILQASRLQL